METDNFEMTQDEMHRIKEAMKDKQFVDLLLEYTKEISDPENKKRYEQEIIAMERERGNNVRVLVPQSGFVVKTTRLSDGMKVFINICTSPEIQDCSMTAETRNGKSGTHVSLPHSLSPIREDIDKAGKSCLVYDVCFHPNSYAKSLEDIKFRQILIDTAFDTIEKQGNITLDRIKKRFPKMKYKGIAQTNIIRPIALEEGCNLMPKNDTKNDTVTQPCMPLTKDIILQEINGASTNGDSNSDDVTKVNVPQYKVIHRGYFDMQNFTYAKEDRSTIPKELVVEISLPLAESAAGIDLDIFEKDLVLNSIEPPYHLEISLPYNVNDVEGKAQFNAVEKVLVVTLPVVNQQNKAIHEISIQPLVEDITPCVSNGEQSDITHCVVNGDITCCVENGEQSEQYVNNVDSNMESLCGQIDKTLLRDDTLPSMLHTSSDENNTDTTDNGIDVVDIDTISCIVNNKDIIETDSSHADGDRLTENTFESLESRLSQLLQEEGCIDSTNKNNDINGLDEGECIINIHNNQESLSRASASQPIPKQSEIVYSGIEDDISSSASSFKESVTSLQSYGSYDGILVSKSPTKRSSQSDTEYCDTEDDSPFSMKESFTPEHKYCSFEGTLRRSKSDGEYWDTEDDISCSTNSFRDSVSSEQNNCGRRRRIKSVTFDDKPTIFEFVNVTKRQMKKQRKEERRRQVYEQKNLPCVKDLESSEMESTEGDGSDHEQKGKPKKKGKREKKNHNYSTDSLPQVPNGILTTHNDDTSQKKKKKKKKKKRGIEGSMEDSNSNTSDNLPCPDVNKETGTFSNQLMFELD